MVGAVKRFLSPSHTMIYGLQIMGREQYLMLEVFFNDNLQSFGKVIFDIFSPICLFGRGLRNLNLEIVRWRSRGRPRQALIAQF